MRLRLLAAFALVALVLPPARAADLNVITAVEVKDEGATVVLSVKGTKKPSFTTFSMAEPSRFVIDFSESRFEGVPETLTVQDGTVDMVKNLSYGSDASSIARVMIAFAVEVAPPEVSDAGETLLVRIAKPGAAAAPAVASRRDDEAAAARARAEQEAQAKAEADRRAREDEEARKRVEAELRARAEAEAEARAKAEAEASAKAEVEAQARKDAAASAPAGVTAPAAPAAPAMPDAATLEAEAAAARAEAQRRAAADREAQARADAEARARAEAERAQAAAASSQAGSAPGAEAEPPAAQAAAAARPERRSGAGAPSARLREVGFKQVGGVSRVYVRTTVTPRFTIQDVGNDTIRIELENTRPERRNDLRFLDTSFFSSAVAMITPARRGSSYVLDIKLKERVPYQQRIEGDLLAIEFEGPARAAAPAAGAEPPAAPAAADTAADAEPAAPVPAAAEAPPEVEPAR
jgi:colicin import membrane protein